ncbi:hypothetical protein AJ78_03060 [Emergomyces pasteurianus Ep9510]|uniref:Uncharacterized protein n=1 Tax=Emergomyces pasteurianus Ep9510 TaxID=1447872 RepID=A0A1J9PK43_9EURO|nr:hypothetical protein AJ78_03060 [Emergomyces pasteurianus Ep9510]
MPVSTRFTNREETPENQNIAPGSFPTPTTNQKPRNNATVREDMADQDETAVLRQRIAQLNVELQQMRASIATANTHKEILLAIKQSHTEDILTTKPLETASKDMKRFWEERNSWLYNFIRRARLFKEFNDMTATATFGGFNRPFLERLLTIRVEYIRLGYTTTPNFIFFDKLLNGLTKSWSSFIKDRMDQVAKDGNTPSAEDDILGLCKDILLQYCH